MNYSQQQLDRIQQQLQDLLNKKRVDIKINGIATDEKEGRLVDLEITFPGPGKPVKQSSLWNSKGVLT